MLRDNEEEEEVYRGVLIFPEGPYVDLGPRVRTSMSCTNVVLNF